MENAQISTVVDLQEVSVSGVVRDSRFIPAAALNVGVLGRRPAQATTSGIEAVICCHSAIAWA